MVSKCKLPRDWRKLKSIELLALFRSYIENIHRQMSLCAEIWKELSNRGDVDLSRLSGPYVDLVRLTAEGKLVPDILDLCPNPNKAKIFSNLPPVVQKRIISQGAFTVPADSRSDNVRKVPLAEATHEIIAQAVDLEAGKLRSVREQQEVMKAREIHKRPLVKSPSSDGPITYVECGKSWVPHVGKVALSRHDLINALMKLSKGESVGEPTEKVAIKLTRKELENAQRVVDNSNGQYSSVGDYIRRKAVAYDIL